MSQWRLGDLSVEAPGYTPGYWNKTDKGDRLVLGIWALNLRVDPLFAFIQTWPYCQAGIISNEMSVLNSSVCIYITVHFCIQLDITTYFCEQLQMTVIESMRLCISTAWSCTHQFHLLGLSLKLKDTDWMGLDYYCIPAFLCLKIKFLGFSELN